MKEFIIIVIITLVIFILFRLENKVKLFSEIFNENPYEDYIVKYADYFGVDSLLVKVVMKRESNLSHNAVSNKGAVGLMQIMPKTASEIAKQLNIMNYSDNKLKEVEINIMFGIYYLRKLLNYYNDNLILSLAAYNAGLGNVENWYSKNRMLAEKTCEIPFKETRSYVRSIIFTYKIYKFFYAFKDRICFKSKSIKFFCEIMMFLIK
ncbi:MAG: lytic transglycosylase domain-containing protein [Endomicrobium sp.]|jgi:soluble lytic murein transglycosylase|nr:lytic transglycosylase domain-containing protein [Endomicrobium sp.]